jgi:hypothetical protein
MIYRIHPVTSKYICFHIRGGEACRVLREEADFNIDPSPISYSEKNWQPMKVEFLDHEAGVDASPDIAMRVGKLFLSQKAYMAF